MKINSIVFYVLMAISLVVVALFCFSDSKAVVYNNVSFEEPNQTSTFLIWTYVLFGLACLATLAAACISFVNNSRKDPKNAIKTVVVFVSLALLLLITYMIGDGSELEIIGYTGTDNKDPFWLKLSDMCLYSTYVLLFIGAFAAIAGNFVKKIK